MINNHLKETSYFNKTVEYSIERRIEQRLLTKQIKGEIRILKNAKEILLNNIEKRIVINDLCKQVGTNPSTLSKLFNEKLNQSPFAWLKKERLTLAARLLIKTDCKIYHIAYEVGYLDANNFSTAFRQYFGVTPKGFRKSKETEGNAKLCVA
jgi:AraC-like DNA-binding protein